MPGLDIFNDDAFSVQSLTASVNNEPHRPGQIGASGMFEEDSVTTTIVSIEERDGALSLVEPSERGGPGETATGEGRRLIPFEVDHYERNDSVKADEVQNIRAFGSESEVEQVESRVMSKANRHLLDLDMTLEHQRVGAIKGLLHQNLVAFFTICTIVSELLCPLQFRSTCRVMLQRLTKFWSRK